MHPSGRSQRPRPPHAVAVARGTIRNPLPITPPPPLLLTSIFGGYLDRRGGSRPPMVGSCFSFSGSRVCTFHGGPRWLAWQGPPSSTPVAGGTFVRPVLRMGESHDGEGDQEAQRMAGLLAARRALRAGLERPRALGHALALGLLAIQALLPTVEASVRLMLSGSTVLAGVPVVAGQFWSTSGRFWPGRRP